MTIQVWIDGWPFKVTFTGTIEIGRVPDDLTVRFSADKEAFIVEEETEALEENRRVVAEVKSRYWHGKLPAISLPPSDYPWRRQ